MNTSNLTTKNVTITTFSATVLISGRGSNLKQLLAKQELGYQIKTVITDNPESGGLEYANEYKVKTEIVDRKAYATKKDFNSALFESIKNSDTDIIILAGFMRIISPEIVNYFHGKIINIHPSLLPLHPGLDTHKKAIEAKDTKHGCTVHFLDAGIDTGPIIAQSEVAVYSDDTIETLSSRVLAQEHLLFPWVVKMIANKEIYFDIQNKKVIYSDLAIKEAKNMNFKVNTNGKN